MTLFINLENVYTTRLIVWNIYANFDTNNSIINI